MRVQFAIVRAEALFLVDLPADTVAAMTDLQIRTLIATKLRELGVRGVACACAQEYGDHPETAPRRMCRARAVVDIVYPTPTGKREREPVLAAAHN